MEEPDVKKNTQLRQFFVTESDVNISGEDVAGMNGKRLKVAK